MANALFDIETNYGYDHMFGEVMDNLEFALHKRNLAEAFQGDFDLIGQNMKDIAQTLVRSNRTIDTFKMHDSISYEKTSNGLRLFVPSSATDNRGRYYAGHIEYGFTQIHAGYRDEWGVFIPLKRDLRQFKGPYPFLRPALRYGADMSANRIGESFAAMITGERRWFMQKPGSDANLLLGSGTSVFSGYTGTNRSSWSSPYSQFSWRNDFMRTNSGGNIYDGW